MEPEAPAIEVEFQMEEGADLRSGEAGGRAVRGGAIRMVGFAIGIVLSAVP
jgi:hypothetical protein